MRSGNKRGWPLSIVLCDLSFVLCALCFELCALSLSISSFEPPLPSSRPNLKGQRTCTKSVGYSLAAFLAESLWLSDQVEFRKAAPALRKRRSLALLPLIGRYAAKPPSTDFLCNGQTPKKTSDKNLLTPTPSLLYNHLVIELNSYASSQS